jgi:hypothetical protein
METGPSSVAALRRVDKMPVLRLKAAAPGVHLPHTGLRLLRTCARPGRFVIDELAETLRI